MYVIVYHFQRKWLEEWEGFMQEKWEDFNLACTSASEVEGELRKYMEDKSGEVYLISQVNHIDLKLATDIFKCVNL